MKQDTVASRNEFLSTECLGKMAMKIILISNSQPEYLYCCSCPEVIFLIACNKYNFINQELSGKERDNFFFLLDGVERLKIKSLFLGVGTFNPPLGFCFQAGSKIKNIKSCLFVVGFFANWRRKFSAFPEGNLGCFLWDYFMMGLSLPASPGCSLSLFFPHIRFVHLISGKAKVHLIF